MKPALNITTGMPASVAASMGARSASASGTLRASASTPWSMAFWMRFACCVTSPSPVYCSSTPVLAAASSAPERMMSQNVSPAGPCVTMATSMSAGTPPPPPPPSLLVSSCAPPVLLHPARPAVSARAARAAPVLPRRLVMHVIVVPICRSSSARAGARGDVAPELMVLMF